LPRSALSFVTVAKCGGFIEIMAQKLGWMALLLAFAIGCGLAQDAPVAAEKHVKDIKTEQPLEKIEGSPLCVQARENGWGGTANRELNPATLEKDLRALMQKSDEVVLVGGVSAQTMALSPSGRLPVHYWDVTVIRTWKGRHQPGDLLTLGLPDGYIPCGYKMGIGDAVDHGKWMPDWSLGDGAYVLFLTYDRTGFVDGLRLTGGEGTQGLFDVKLKVDEYKSLSDCGRYAQCRWTRDSNGHKQCVEQTILIDELKKCDAELSKSQSPIAIGNSLPQKYNGMPLSQFLKEMHSLADSLNKPEQDASTQ
jgi:hypothetical protein